MADPRPARAPLVIAVAQPPVVPLDLEANAVAHAAAVRAAAARVVAFPELSLTGYELDASALDPRDPRLAPISAACTATGSIALVGAPVGDDVGGRSIGMLAIDAVGVRIAYRKVWLGGDEPGRFSPGRSPTVLDVDGWRLALAICRDTGVPEHAAAAAALGMDVYVAGVVEFAQDAVVPDRRARRVAADHQVWVAIASSAGPSGGAYDPAAGGSGIWAPDGTPVARAGERPGEIVRATLA